MPASRSRKRISERMPGKAPRQRPRTGAIDPPRREERAEVGGAERADVGNRRRRAEMVGQEAGELRDVAVIGLERVGSDPAFRSEMPAPRRDRRAEIWRGGDEDGGGVRG